MGPVYRRINFSRQRKMEYQTWKKEGISTQTTPSCIFPIQIFINHKNGVYHFIIYLYQTYFSRIKKKKAQDQRKKSSAKTYQIFLSGLLDISLINVNVILQDIYFVHLLYSFVLCPLFSFSVRALFIWTNIIFFRQFLV